MNTFTIEPPHVPIALADGLIMTSDLGSEVLVFFPIWSGAMVGDTYQLVINDEPIAAPVPIIEPAGTLSLSIPVNSVLTRDGTYAVGYRVTNAENGVTADSSTTLIQIDRTSAGAALLARIEFCDASFGELLKGKIPGYFKMAVGDLIQAICNSTPGPSYRVRQDNLTSTPIELSFPRAFMEGLDSDKVTITYHVTDRAGNQSILAQPVKLTLQR
jgi:hypothetical protein